MNTTLKEVKKERTDWRDMKLMQKLNDYGFYPFSTFLMTEYNHGKSVAMIEYIKDNGIHRIPDARIIHYCSLRKNPESYFTVRFRYEISDNRCRIISFTVQPQNQNAKMWLNKDTEMNEKEFICFLYRIRGSDSSEYLKTALDNLNEWFDISSAEPDRIISCRHRMYAYDVPAADIDSMLCDCNNIPYLFVEYKENNNIQSQLEHNHFVLKYIDLRKRELNKTGYEKVFNKAIQDLGDGCQSPLPVILVEYNFENNLFDLYAFNKRAMECVRLGQMQEDEYFEYISNPANFRDSVKTCPKCGKPLKMKRKNKNSFYKCEHCFYMELS